MGALDVNTINALERLGVITSEQADEEFERAEREWKEMWESAQWWAETAKIAESMRPWWQRWFGESALIWALEWKREQTMSDEAYENTDRDLWRERDAETCSAWSLTHDRRCRKRTFRDGLCDTHFRRKQRGET